MAKKETPKAENGNGAKATKCAITRAQFAAHAKPFMVQIGDSKLVANVKTDFSSGSVGWYAGEKIVVEIDGVPVKVQVGLNLTVVGSKELPK